MLFDFVNVAGVDPRKAGAKTCIPARCFPCDFGMLDIFAGVAGVVQENAHPSRYNFFSLLFSPLLLLSNCVCSLHIHETLLKYTRNPRKIIKNITKSKRLQIDRLAGVHILTPANRQVDTRDTRRNRTWRAK